jgi:8-oxo-dGTP pyrophosphatase MutT (NUDIX family)
MSKDQSINQLGQNKNDKKSKIKKSYGIICIRTLKGIFEIILIKKPITYYYSEFINGNYSKSSKDSYFMKLFNNMTYYEKLDILTLNFANIWNRVYRINPESPFLYIQDINNKINYSTYISKKTKFENTFLQDKGKKLKNLIGQSKNIDTLWEVPKGKKNYNEGDLDTAIREFTEETNINSDKYKLLLHIKPYIETYTDFNITYQSIFYFAEISEDFEPKLSLNCTNQISEVANIQWCNINNLKYMMLDKKSYNRMFTMFKIIQKKYKNHLKIKY